MPEGGHWKPIASCHHEFPTWRASTPGTTRPKYQPLIALRKESTTSLDMMFNAGRRLNVLRFKLRDAMRGR